MFRTKRANIQRIYILPWPCVQPGHICMCMLNWYVIGVCICVWTALEPGLGTRQTSGRCSESIYRTDLLRGTVQWTSVTQGNQTSVPVPVHTLRLKCLNDKNNKCCVGIYVKLQILIVYFYSAGLTTWWSCKKCVYSWIWHGHNTKDVFVHEVQNS